MLIELKYYFNNTKALIKSYLLIEIVFYKIINIFLPVG